MVDFTPNEPSWLPRMPAISPVSPNFTYASEQPSAPPSSSGFFTPALASGAFGFLGGAARAIQAGGAAVGAPGIAEWGQAHALKAEQEARQWTNPDIEKQPWYYPEHFAYGLLQSAPTLALAGLMGGGAGGLAGVARGGAAFLPQMIGQNVQEEQATHGGELSQGGALKAIGIGLPEAAAAGWIPHELFGSGAAAVAGGFGTRAFKEAAKVGGYQAALGAGITATTQQAYHPDMPAVDRATQIVDRAMQGGAFGAALGGAFGALRGKALPLRGEPGKISNDALKAATDPAVPISPPSVAPVAPVAPGAPPETAVPSSVASGVPLPVDPVVTAFRATMFNAEGIADKTIAKFRKDPDYANVTDEPSMVMALREKLASYLEEGEDPPKMLQRLFAKYGGHETFDTTALGDKLKTAKLTEAERNEVQQHLAWHTEADAREELANPTLPEKPTADMLLNHPLVRASLAKVRFDTSGTVKDAVGIDVNDPSLIHIDSRINDEKPPDQRATATIDGIETPVFQLVARHEIPEAVLIAQLQKKFPNMDADKLYQMAHKEGGIVAERQAVRQFAAANGKDPDIFEKAYNGWWDSQIEKAEKPKPNIANAPVAQYPYEKHHIAGEKDTPFGGGENAVREPGTAGVDVRQLSENGGRVGEAYPQGNVPAQEAASRGVGESPTLQEILATQQPQVGPKADFTNFGKVDPVKEQQAADVSKTGIQIQPALEVPTLRDRIQQAYLAVTGGNYNRQALLSDIRAQLPDISKKDLDAALMETPNILRAFDNQAMLTTANREGALNFKGIPMHAITMRPPIQSVLEVPARQPVTFGKAEGKLAPVPTEEPVRQLAESTKETIPNFMYYAANTVGGDIVAHDPNHGLLKTVNEDGHTLYLPVDRASNAIGSDDIRSGKLPSWLVTDPKKAAQFRRLALLDVAKSRRMQQERPDGPFRGEQGQVVGTTNAAPWMVSLVDHAMRVIGLGKLRILIVHPDDVPDGPGDQHGLFGDYSAARAAGLPNHTWNGFAATFGPDSTDFAIYIKPGMGMPQQLGVLAHEMGHVILKTAFRNAPVEVQQALLNAHQIWRNTLGSHVSKQAFLRSIKSPAMIGQLDHPDAPMTSLGEDYLNYATSWDEFAADMTGRALLHQVVNTTPVGKFFLGIANRIRGMLQAITGEDLPDQAFANFIDYMKAHAGEDNAHGWGKELSNRAGHRFPEGNDLQAERTIQESERDGRGAVNAISNLWDRVKALGSTTKVGVYNNTLGGRHLDSLVNSAPEHMRPSMRYTYDMHNHGDMLTSATNLVTAMGMRLARASPDTTQKLVNIVADDLQNPWGIDSRKSWNDHPELHNLKNTPQLQAIYTQMRSNLDAMQRAGGRPALDAMLRLYQILGLQGNVDGADTYIYRSTKAGMPLMGPDWVPSSIRFTSPRLFGLDKMMHDDPTLLTAYNFYKNENTAIMAALEARINAKTGGGASEESVAAERALLTNMQERTKQVEKGTYMPLNHGRGDFFVSGKIALGADKKIDPAAATAVRNALDKGGFERIRLAHDSGSNTLFARVDDQATMDRLKGIFQDLHKQEHLLPDEIKSGHPGDTESYARLGPKQFQFVSDVINEALEDVEMKPEERAAIKGRLMSNWMQTLSDTSIIPNEQQRTYAHGHDEDMIKVAETTAINIARAHSTLAMSSRMMDGWALINAAVKAARSDPNISTEDNLKGNDAAREWYRRESEAAWSIPANFGDTVASLMHTSSIGFSLPYMFLPTSQIVTLAHPELAKVFGMARAAYAIGAETSPAFKVLAAVLGSPDRFNVVFRESVVGKAVDEWHTNVVIRMANAGLLNSFTPNMTAMNKALTSTQERILHIANAPGTYAEMLPRLVTGFAAARLYDNFPKQIESSRKGMSRDDYIREAVTNSQFPWGAGENARWLGKKGPLGPATRISFAFMNYQQRMVVKICHEIRSLAGAEGSQAQKEAGTFLMAHLAAATVLAGTLGLPFAGFGAGAFDKLARLFTGRDDVDIQGMYRVWLKHVFGDDVGEIMAKGLPREFGIDLSKVGDQNLLPGTQIMQDKRKLEEATRDWFLSMGGAASSQAVNTLLGLRDMWNGDYLLGATKMLPEQFRSLAEAAYIDKHGYVDKYGNRNKLTPTALEILASALGFDPARLTDIQEQRRTYQGLKAQETEREQNIERHIVLAQRQNPASMPYWTDQARQFQRDHPGDAGPIMRIQAIMQHAAQEQAIAQSENAPPGISPRDWATTYKRVLDFAPKVGGFVQPQ